MDWIFFFSYIRCFLHFIIISSDYHFWKINFKSFFSKCRFRKPRFVIASSPDYHFFLNEVFFNENKILFQLEKKVISSILLMTLVADNRHLSFIFIFKKIFFNENDGKQVTAVFRLKVFYWIRFLIAKFDILIFFFNVQEVGLDFVHFLNI